MGRAGTELEERLHAVAIRLLRHARAEDAASGMSATRLSVLSVLVWVGPRTVSELAHAEQVAVPTMTRLLQALESEGHVRRGRDPGDGRVVRVTVTAAGRRILERARRSRVRRLTGVLNELQPEERAVVLSAVAALERAVHHRLGGAAGNPAP